MTSSGLQIVWVDTLSRRCTGRDSHQHKMMLELQSYIQSFNLLNISNNENAVTHYHFNSTIRSKIETPNIYTSPHRISKRQKTVTLHSLSLVNVLCCIHREGGAYTMRTIGAAQCVSPLYLVNACPPTTHDFSLPRPFIFLSLSLSASVYILRALLVLNPARIVLFLLCSKSPCAGEKEAIIFASAEDGKDPTRFISCSCASSS